jgi:NAD(P)-dependent dehydrogenase (short-subunit alcohol dehydrogenase family)
MSTQPSNQDPKEQGAQPEFPAQPQTPPGSEAAMTPRPDFGEDSYRGLGRLTGKVALITGGDSGIGRAVALAFAREGADVLIAYLNEDEDAQETVRVVEAAGRKAVTIPGDIGDEAHCKALVERTVREFGHLDILVNNAAFQMSHEGLADLPSAEIEHTFRTNIFAIFYLSKAALPQMRPGGVIINTASVEAYQPAPTLLAYAATKGAIVNFTKGLAQDAIKQGIRVNAVAPGPVWTPLIPSTMPEEQVKTFGQNTVFARPAQPIEVATSYVFLASDESRFITGEVIGVTGGKPIS